jgi:predicted metal-dependent hydrolase
MNDAGDNAAFKQRVAAWAKKLRCSPRQIVVMEMRRKWASCSSKGRICFAKDIQTLEEPLQDYIIVHEVLHLKHPNHSRVFRSLLTAYLPGWQSLHAQLRQVLPHRHLPSLDVGHESKGKRN